MRPSPVHFLILVLVIIVIFGAAKLPMVAKNLGKSMKVFKSEVKDLRDDESADDEAKEITDAQRRADTGGFHRAERTAEERIGEPRTEGEPRHDDRL